MNTVSALPTTTASPIQETAVIHLPPLSLDRAHFENRAQALLDIKKQYESSQNKCLDTLSQKLSIWIGIFIQDMAKQSLESVERIQACTAPYLTFLEKKILRDELRSADPKSPVVSLETPVMARKEALEEKAGAEEDLVWEKNVYLRCRVVCKRICPFSHRPMPEVPLPHEYAQAVIDWKATLFPSNARERFFSREVTVMKLATPEEEAQECLRFEELADYVRVRRAAKKSKQKTWAILHAAETSQQETCTLLVQRTHRAALDEAQVTQQLQKTKDFYQEQLDETTALMQSQKQSFDDTICFLEGYLKTAEENNKALAAEIRKQLDQARAQQAQTNQVQAQTVAVLKQETTQKVAELHTYQTLMEARHQTELLQQQALHQKIASGLKQAIGDLRVESGENRKALSLSQQVVKQQDQQINQLAVSNASLQEQVTAAVYRAKNPKKVVLCALM